jgi:hypothetical protein
MTDFMPMPPALVPLAACTIALLSLCIGRNILRTRAIPPLLRPMLRLNGRLGEAPGRKGEAMPAETVRVYGWAFIYAGTLGLIIAGGQLVRLLAAGTV